MTCAAIVLAAGRGSRADPLGGATAKQYRFLAGRPVIARALDAFLDSPQIGTIQVVVSAGTEAELARLVPSHPRLRPPVAGGARRQDSVLAGLEALADAEPLNVLIHDAARPFATPALVGRVLTALDSHPAAIPALPVADTLKRAAGAGLVESTLPREGLVAAQTPQGFLYRAILEAHRKASQSGTTFTDDAAVAEWAGLDVALVAGEAANRKLTSPEDFVVAEALIGRRETRIGSGFDVHRFGPGGHIVLCGVEIPHAQGLIGHSDADVGLHALTDALFGSIAAGDIGSHFPPSDEKWRHADSAIFVEHARDLVATRGGIVSNVDLTIICESPKVAPYRDAMRARIAALLRIDDGRVAVKGTTSERLGFTGRGEGIAAQAVVATTLPVPEDHE